MAKQQVANKEIINTFIGGMNLDADTGSLKQNEYRYAENLRISSTDGSSYGSISQIDLPEKEGSNYL